MTLTYTNTEQYSTADWTYLGEAVANTMNRAIADSMGMTDSLVSVSTLQRALSDTLGLTDSLVRVVSYFREELDTEGLTDTLSQVVSFNKAIEDSLGMTDSLQIVKNVQRAIIDSEGITDQLNGSSSYLRPLTDSEGLTDAVIKISDYQRQFFDQMGITDSLRRVVQFIGASISKFYGIENVKPLFDSIERTSSAFTPSDVIYNDPVITFNDLSTFYGGSDRLGAKLTFMQTIQNISPQMEMVGET